MTKPDPALMQQARDLYEQAAALRDRGLDEEAQLKQEEGTLVWRRALGYVDPVREMR